MIGKEFEKMLAEYTRSAADMDLRIRGLRSTGHLPSIRGRHAPDIDAEQAALMLLSLVSARAVEGGETAAKFAEAREVIKNGDAGDTLLEFLTPFLSSLDPDLGNAFSYGLTRVELSEANGYARAVCKGGSRLFVIDDATRAKLADSTESLDDAFRFGFDRLTVFSGGLLDALAIELADGDEAGEIIPE